jgi:hypothetical protein
MINITYRTPLLQSLRNFSYFFRPGLLVSQVRPTFLLLKWCLFLVIAMTCSRSESRSRSDDCLRKGNWSIPKSECLCNKVTDAVSMQHSNKLLKVGDSKTFNWGLLALLYRQFWHLFVASAKPKLSRTSLWKFDWMISRPDLSLAFIPA